MKVYVLLKSKKEDVEVVAVFCSRSAMLGWLREFTEYVSDASEVEDGSVGWFTKLTKDGYVFSYEMFNLIGFHSHKTNTIKFD